jgi:uncharacterized protein
VSDENAVITVRLTPRAARDEISGWVDDVLQTRVSAPPVDGRANVALVRLIAAALRIPQSRVAVVSGQTARLKRIRVEGLSVEEVKRRLGAG